jgi:transposase
VVQVVKGKPFRMEGMKSYRTYPLDFKSQVVQAHLAGESMYALAKRHNLSRNLIRTWVAKFQGGELGLDGRAVGGTEKPAPSLFTQVKPVARPTSLEAYEARIADLERMIGRQALELDILKEALHRATQARKPTKSDRGTG